MDDWVCDRLATAACVLPVLAYVGLFLLRREVALVPRTALALLGLGVGVRLALLAAGFGLDGATLVLSLLFAALVMAVLLTRGWAYFIHAPEAAVRSEIDEACRRLFLQKEEPQPGKILLTARGSTVVLWLTPQGRSCVILLPWTHPPGKLTLFHDWLVKRYPGPVPRIRVDLTRR